jgi:hypothetical protein
MKLEQQAYEVDSYELFTKEHEVGTAGAGVENEEWRLEGKVGWEEGRNSGEVEAANWEKNQ